MYAILISIALAIYSVILADFSVFLQEMSSNNEVITSAQAFYSAEGAAEFTLASAGRGEISERNLKFKDEKGNTVDDRNSTFLPYNEGADSGYLARKMIVTDKDLSFTSLEPTASRAFALRETPNENNFNELRLDFNEGAEGSDLLFEIFIFPREGSALAFPTFEALKNDAIGPVHRISINSRDATLDGKTLEGLTIYFSPSSAPFKNQISVAGFQPIAQNYLIRFQTLDNKPVHHKLSAWFQNAPVAMPSLSQTVDVIGSTPSGLYQRVKVQRLTEEGLKPGLGFTLFSDGPIRK